MAHGSQLCRSSDSLEGEAGGLISLISVLILFHFLALYRSTGESTKLRNPCTANKTSLFGVPSWQLFLEKAFFPRIFSFSEHQHLKKKH